MKNGSQQTLLEYTLGTKNYVHGDLKECKVWPLSTLSPAGGTGYIPKSYYKLALGEVTFGILERCPGFPCTIGWWGGAGEKTTQVRMRCCATVPKPTRVMPAFTANIL